MPSILLLECGKWRDAFPVRAAPPGVRMQISELDSDIRFLLSRISALPESTHHGHTRVDFERDARVS